ncbi:Putative sporulation transcription regulator WhiA [Peptoniphilus indolicus]|uniref:Probable cell division protein WhiA n=1 Tax=Peptoniphilus indolicus TaxID=33030 RepID=A0A379DCE7_9FIRM|nr:DNA-binding protein WhiA [Peptoniphilus indolicus]SUB75271.1 Putative sporulation transcription regulator WhiA [Peptoniphilus indolicus]
MSFSFDVKNELARIKLNDLADIIAELSAYIRMCGALQLSGDGIRVRFNTENAAIGRRIFTFLKDFYSKDVEVKISQSRQLKKNNIYTIVLEDENACKLLFYDSEFITGENVFVQSYSPYRVIRWDSAKRAYIRAAFLGAGSISNPEKYYHLEFVSNNEEHANFVSDILNEYCLNSKVIARKEYFITYIKGAEQISDLLSLMGAQRSMLKFEDIRVYKDLNNNVNRLVNMESANLNKIVNNSVKQVIDINLIEEKLGLNSLPESLQQVARLRLEDESLSLKEIGMMLDPKIGKSGVNHRFNKIREIANEIRGEQNGYKESNIE